MYNKIVARDVKRSLFYFDILVNKYLKMFLPIIIVSLS